ncbi:MAG TPA: M20/M25/M40 family metallo-hydrolase [Gemmatimonadaceae bacterium]|nr:M20/M25/M40 family metallo-hydrolase [Gemmatimonadaceae bacterium]
MRGNSRSVRLVAALVAAAFPLVSAGATAQVVQERVDLGVIARIREEAAQHPQAAELERHLTDVIGPRLTGSTGMRRANDWTAETLRSWGLSNVQVEPWGVFGRGWERVSYSGRMLTPFVQPLHAQPAAWTGSTKGTVTAPAIAVVGGLDSLSKYAGKLKGAWVLLEEPRPVTPEFDPVIRRQPLDSLLAVRPRRRERPPVVWDSLLAQVHKRERARDSVLRAAGVAGVITRSPLQYDIIRGGGDWGAIDPSVPIPVPELIVEQDEYDQIWRNATHGVGVQLEISVQNRFLTDDLKGYNTLADLPGTDKANEFVMIGGHLDSWHFGTGATDNAAGTVVMMEAMRILKTLGLQPRRTIRIALWSGEEEGLYGSRHWLANHPELHDRISAYLNLDNGTGKIRGIWDQSNQAAHGIFEQLLWPFRDLGVVAVRAGNTGSTDHVAFDDVGIPGFNFIQDPIEYGLRTHHSSVDTYDHALTEDLEQAAIVVAATAYALAMRDDPMPRKPAGDAPAAASGSATRP